MKISKNQNNKIKTKVRPQTCTRVIFASAVVEEDSEFAVATDDDVELDDNKLAACAAGMLGRIPVRSGGEEKLGCDAIDGIL